MRDLAAKLKILRDNGYTYGFDRELYVNRRLRKAFSVQFIEGKSEHEIEKNAPGSSPRWQFFFTTPPSQAVERELAKMLG
jgi:hypothetical protein